MNKVLLLVFICSLSLAASAQTTVNRKIAQRYDEYKNSTWEGKDSVVYSYNAFGLEAQRLSVKGTGATNWNNFYRNTTTYDANGNVSIEIREFWDGTNWLNNAKFTYTYNANNQPTVSLYETWNSSTNTWSPAGRIVNTYNSNNLLTKIATDTWNGAWFPSTKQDWYYNGSNELMTKESYSFINNAWQGQSRSQYVHAFGYVSNLIESVWNNGGWVLNKQVISQINGSVTPARVVSVTNYYRNLISNTWGFSNRAFYGYTNNLLSSIQTEIYDTSASIWRSLALTSNTYNTNSLLTEQINQQYNPSTTVYDNDKRRVLAYTGNNLTDQVTYYTGVGSTSWALSARDQYTYNASDSLTYLLVEDYIGSNFTPSKQYFYHYTDVAVGVNNVNTLFENATLYPNPATTNVYIKTNETLNGAYLAIIFSIDGRRVWSQISTYTRNDFNFDISALPTGNYVLQLNEISSGKSQHFKLNKR